MSNAFEITIFDIEHVLTTHDTCIQSLVDDVDFDVDFDVDTDDIEKSILRYTDFDDQVDCMHSEIEDQLIEGSFIEGPKQFNCP